MKTLSAIFLLVSILIVTGCTRDSNMVADAYEAAILSPDGFDSYVRSNLLENRDAFRDCVDKVRGRLINQGGKLRDYCKSVPEAYYTKCSRTIETELIPVLDSMSAVVLRGVHWKDTLHGMSAGMGMQSGEHYTEYRRAVMPAIKDVLRCE